MSNSVIISTGNRIRIAREKLGLTQTEFALVVHSSKSVVSDIENDRRELRVSELKEWSKALNLQAEDLL